jgi:uncharacterized membrane protein
MAGDRTVSSEDVDLRTGLLPPSSELAQYEAIAPGLAGELFEMAKAEQQHRHLLDQQEASRADRGQYLAAGLVLVMAVLAAFCVAVDADSVASIIVSSTIIAVLVVFVLGKLPVLSRLDKEAKSVS